MARKIPLKGAWLKVRQTPLVDRWIASRGPGVRRVPPLLRERAVLQEAIPSLPHVQSWRFGEAEVVRPQPPDPIVGQDGHNLLPLALRPHRLSQPFVARVEEAWLVGRHATPWTSGGRMLLTPFRDRLPMLGAEEHPDLLDWARGPSRAQGEEEHASLAYALCEGPVCSLVGRLDINFFHWIVDSCAQLEGLQVYEERTGEKPKILIRRGAPPFVRASLTLLGYDESRLLEWPVTFDESQSQSAPPLALRAPRLVVPAWPHYNMGLSPRSLLWLRRTFLRAAGVGDELEATDKSSGPMLYVNRPRGNWRCVANEEEVLSWAEQRGFRVLSPESLSLAEQVRLFASSRALVGMHGAGLTNLLFAPRAAFVELIGSYGGGDYFSMARGLGNPLARLVCEDRGEDIFVDTARLGRVLQTFDL